MTSKKIEQVRKALDQFGVDFGSINFIETDAMETWHQQIRVHQTDRTPVIVDPDLGGDGSPREVCYARQSSTDICGMSRTTSNGRFTWKLSDFQCGPVPQQTAYELPHAFVATAMSGEPVFMTARSRRIDADVEFDVFSWLPSGEAAPNTRFSWRYWVTAAVPIVE